MDTLKLSSFERSSSGGPSFHTSTARGKEDQEAGHSVPEELQEQEEEEDQEQVEDQGDKVVRFAKDVITFHNN